jgi:hypothetical protein
MQVPSRLGHLPLFCISYFSDGILHFCLGQPHSDCDPPPYTSCVAGITGTHYHTQLVSLY